MNTDLRKNNYLLWHMVDCMETFVIQLFHAVLKTSPFLDLLQAMESCLAIIKAFPFLLDVVYNIKEWLLPHAEELHAHTQPKSFKFVRDEEGHCIMYYRNYSHMKWEGPQRILKVLSCMVQ